jgi:hypothetical protein
LAQVNSVFIRKSCLSLLFNRKLSVYRALRDGNAGREFSQMTASGRQTGWQTTDGQTAFRGIVIIDGGISGSLTLKENTNQ